MLDFIDPRFVAAAQLATALGIAYFWFTWFRTPHTESWLPKGYLEHERCFVYPDSVLSVLLVTSALLLWQTHPLGASLALVCAGMALFLAVIDTAYFLQHGMFSRHRGGFENLLGVVLPLYALSALQILRFT